MEKKQMNKGRDNSKINKDNHRKKGNNDKRRNTNKENRNNVNRNQKKTKMKKWKKVLIIVGLLLIIAGAVFAYRVHINGGGLQGMLATMVGHDENTKKDLGEFRVLVLGISTDQEGVDLTDTIMVASYNPNTQKANLLSIPRDTYIGKTPSKATAYEKINALYNRKHRPDETLKAINEITGLGIENYIVIKTEALIKLVDVIGGVNFNVPIDMTYDDPTQDLKIDLKAGEQLLDGDKAEQLVRFRHNNDGSSYPEEYGDNDTGRMRTQREFIMQTLKQTLKPGNIFKLNEIIEIANEYIITNVDMNVAKDYVPYAVEFSTDNMHTNTLPGTNSNKNTSETWVFIHNKTETKQLIDEMFLDDNDETEQGTTNNNTTNNNTANTQSSTSTTSVTKSTAKIELLNGSGTTNTLQKVTKELEAAGYKVTRTGTTNATSKTTIVNKKDVSDTFLKDLKTTLGVGTISDSQSSSSKVDITIIIGKDYK